MRYFIDTEFAAEEAFAVWRMADGTEQWERLVQST